MILKRRNLLLTMLGAFAAGFTGAVEALGAMLARAFWLSHSRGLTLTASRT
jgi:hypothetical protein